MQIRIRTTFLYFSVFLFNFYSCTDEPDLIDYTIVLGNDSGTTVNISLFYNDFGSPRLYDSFSLKTSEEYQCSYKSEFFTGLRGCLNSNSRGLDSLRLVFDNGKGYVCTDVAINTQNYCAKEFYSISTNTFEEIAKNTFRVSITQEDFENAFELPE